MLSFSMDLTLEEQSTEMPVGYPEDKLFGRTRDEGRGTNYE